MRLLLCLLLACGSALAQPYPTKPVRIMVGASAGGGTDIIARMLADKFSDSMKQPFIVENRPGASNTIAADITAKAPADGHTLLVATNTAQSIAPHLIKLAYDPLKDVQPVGLIVVVPNVLIVGPAVKAKSVQELLADMRATSAPMRYATAGTGSTQHIAAEAFAKATGTKLVHVPYKGSSQAHVDLISGQVEMMFDTTSSAMGQIKAGRLRPLAVTTAKRSAEMPDVPTLAESGVAGAEMSTWYGLFTTGGTPSAIVERLHGELSKALALQDVRGRLNALAGEPGALSVREFTEMNRGDYERSGRLIREAGIKID
jgi:tripartite-type tricarboxylate transporter receptor subunit TctC